MSLVLAVSGSRGITDASLVQAAVRWAMSDVGATVVHVGDCPRGVDPRVVAYAKGNGIEHRVFRADWDRHGKPAGPIRNREMLQGANALLAVWDGKSRGTLNAIKTAEAMRLPVVIFHAPCGTLSDHTVWRLVHDKEATT